MAKTTYRFFIVIVVTAILVGDLQSAPTATITSSAERNDVTNKDATANCPVVENQGKMTKTEDIVYHLSATEKYTRSKRSPIMAQLAQPATPVSPFLSTIEPGSRALSPFYNDPTVSCTHNPYQMKCSKYNKHNVEDRNHQERDFTRPSCADFYNKSDDMLLWWQALRHEAKFQPQNIIIYMDNENLCPDESRVDFYISEKLESHIKDVDCQRGLRLRKQITSEPDNISVCYFAQDASLPPDHYVTLVFSFIHCLFHYGNSA